mmetsp:Transcript_36734/g.110885  ORF Transcript_36734/g.110885 Transcript_36734/m.110885 type:complete len:206 (+) Transcript_36734:1109-1726(+)
MPLAISWKARDKMGAGMLSTPEEMFSTISSWIHSKINSTLDSEFLIVSRLSSSIPSASISSNLKALTSAMCDLLLRSSNSAKAEAWSMLKSRTSLCLKLMIKDESAWECAQKETKALQASNHSARIWCVDVAPSQKRLYACDVRNMTRNPTKTLKLFQAALFFKNVISSSGRSIMPRSVSSFKAAAQHAAGKATMHANGKTLPCN